MDASLHPGNATTRGEGRGLFLATLAIVANKQVHPTRNTSRVESDARRGGVALNIGQRFLSDAQKGALQLIWQIVNLRVQTSPDVEP